MESKKYYKRLDLLRVFACIAVLFYHLNILKGGYLAVCTFFVLAGYLGVISAFNKEKFSLKNYYLSRFVNIYIPLLIVVFLSIIVTSFFPSINWVNEKPESISVIFGYNNFWQLSANLDYFTRLVGSPFTHFWYMAILIQFDIVFPIIFMLLKKLGEKTKKYIPCIIVLVLMLASLAYFYYLSLNSQMMVVYYSSLGRIFSILFGCAAGFIHHYYRQVSYDKKYSINLIIYILYFVALILMNIFIDSLSSMFAVSMILTTIISCRLIDYSTSFEKNMPRLDKGIKYAAKISYEIYLVQYPVIFFMQSVNINYILKVLLDIVITLLLAAALNFLVNYKGKNKVLQFTVSIVLIAAVVWGAYILYNTEDHTKEMKELENQLLENSKLIEEKNEAYMNSLKEQENKWNEILNDLEKGENELKDVVKNLPIVGVGDSVMLGAVPNLYEVFPNGYFDAKVNRTAYEANAILEYLKSIDRLGDPVVFNLGANGEGPKYLKDEIMSTLEGRTVFWLTVTNDNEVFVNDDIWNYPNEYENIHIIDWNSISYGHPEYFISDGLHLTEIGRDAFAKAVYNSIYEYYLEKFNEKKNEILNSHNEELKSKLTFYGNDICINAFDKLKLRFETARFNISSNYDFDMLYSEVYEKVQDGTLDYNVVFAFDTSFEADYEDLSKLIDLCKEHNIYILNLKENVLEFENDNVTVIDFYDILKENEGYLLADKLHLSNDGNDALVELLYEIISKQSN